MITRTFSIVKLLKSDTAIHTDEKICSDPVDDKPVYTCKLCPVRSTSYSYIRMHRYNKHSHRSLDANGFGKCDKCGKKYKGADGLGYHKAICGKPNHLRCVLCDYSARFRSNIRSHLKVVHKLDIETGLDDVLVEITTKGDDFAKSTLEYSHSLDIVTKI